MRRITALFSSKWRELPRQSWRVFHHYLYGVPFTLMCDHKPLERLGTVHKRTLLRLQELMGQYNFIIEYLPGKMNELADALSRTANVCAVSLLSGEDAVVKEQSRKGIIDGVDTAKWAEEQQKDAYCQAAWALCRKKNKSAAELARVEHYVTDRNVLFREVGRGNGMRSFGVVVLATMQYKAAHASAFAGHKGARITLQRLKERFYWPGMGTDVEAFVAACKVCKESKDPPGMNATREPLKPLAAPSEPNVRVHADLFTPGAVSAAGHKYVLVITDAFSKLAELVPLKDKEAGMVARAIVDTWICRYSTPKVLVTDRGREFCSELADELFSKLGVERRRTSAYHPQTNSSAESFNRELIKIMTTMLDVPDDPEWEARLPTVMLAYNTAVRKTTNSSPFFLTYLRDPAMPFFQLGEMERPFYGEDWALDALRCMREVYAYTADKINQEGERNKRLYDSASGRHQEFSLGETVYVRLDHQSFAKVKNKKWVKCWKEAIITRVLSETTYEVQYVFGDGAL